MRSQPEAIEWLPLNCIRAADLVWLHAPDGYVGLSGALEIGFANAAGVPVYAEEMPSDTRSALARDHFPVGSGHREEERWSKRTIRWTSLLPLQEYYSAVAHGQSHEHRSEHDVVQLITEEIEVLARQNPGQRQRHPHRSGTRAGSLG